MSVKIDATISAKQNILFSSFFFAKSLEVKDEEKSRQGKLHVFPVPSQELHSVTSTCFCFSLHVHPLPSATQGHKFSLGSLDVLCSDCLLPGKCLPPSLFNSSSSSLRSLDFSRKVSLTSLIRSVLLT